MDLKTNVWSSERQSIAKLELHDLFEKNSLVALASYAHPLVRWAIDERGIYFVATKRQAGAVPDTLREDVLAEGRLWHRLWE